MITAQQPLSKDFYKNVAAVVAARFNTDTFSEVFVENFLNSLISDISTSQKVASLSPLSSTLPEGRTTSTNKALTKEPLHHSNFQPRDEKGRFVSYDSVSTGQFVSSKEAVGKNEDKNLEKNVEKIALIVENTFFGSRFRRVTDDQSVLSVLEKLTKDSETQLKKEENQEQQDPTSNEIEPQDEGALSIIKEEINALTEATENLTQAELDLKDQNEKQSKEANKDKKEGVYFQGIRKDIQNIKDAWNELPAVIDEVKTGVKGAIKGTVNIAEKGVGKILNSKIAQKLGLNNIIDAVEGTYGTTNNATELKKADSSKSNNQPHPLTEADSSKPNNQPHPLTEADSSKPNNQPHPLTETESKALIEEIQQEFELKVEELKEGQSLQAKLIESNLVSTKDANKKVEAKIEKQDKNKDTKKTTETFEQDQLKEDREDHQTTTLLQEIVELLDETFEHQKQVSLLESEEEAWDVKVLDFGSEARSFLQDLFPKKVQDAIFEIKDSAVEIVKLMKDVIKGLQEVKEAAEEGNGGGFGLLDALDVMPGRRRRRRRRGGPTSRTRKRTPKPSSPRTPKPGAASPKSKSDKPSKGPKPSKATTPKPSKATTPKPSKATTPKPSKAPAAPKARPGSIIPKGAGGAAKAAGAAGAVLAVGLTAYELSQIDEMEKKGEITPEEAKQMKGGAVGGGVGGAGGAALGAWGGAAAGAAIGSIVPGVGTVIGGVVGGLIGGFAGGMIGDTAGRAVGEYATGPSETPQPETQKAAERGKELAEKMGIDTSAGDLQIQTQGEVPISINGQPIPTELLTKEEQEKIGVAKQAMEGQVTPPPTPGIEAKEAQLVPPTAPAPEAKPWPELASPDMPPSNKPLDVGPYPATEIKPPIEITPSQIPSSAIPSITPASAGDSEVKVDVSKQKDEADKGLLQTIAANTQQTNKGLHELAGAYNNFVRIFEKFGNNVGQKMNAGPALVNLGGEGATPPTPPVPQSTIAKKGNPVIAISRASSEQFRPIPA